MADSTRSEAVDRAALEDAVVERVGEDDLLAQLEREAYPDDPKEYAQERLKSRKGAVVVSYAGSRKVKGGEARSNREFVVDLGVLGPGRRGRFGVLEYIRRLENLFDARKLLFDGEDGAGRFGFEVSVSSDQFIDEVEGVWQYVVKLRCARL